ncbi:hypothetical protein ACS0TY_027947 [Phlomoides rotata]
MAHISHDVYQNFHVNGAVIWIQTLFRILCSLRASSEKSTYKVFLNPSTSDVVCATTVHIPSSVDLHLPLPSKECPSCDGSLLGLLATFSILKNVNIIISLNTDAVVPIMCSLFAEDVLFMLNLSCVLHLHYL